MFLENFFRFMGSLVCHQIQDRTLIIDGLPLPVCSRDTGIYLGVFAGIVFLGLKRKLDADWPPRLAHALVLIIMMVPMIIDGATSYIGFRHTDNLTRLITGGFFGFQLAVFFTVARNYNPEGKNKIAPLNNLGELVIPVILFVLFLGLVYKGQIWWVVVSLLLITGMTAMFYMIADSVVSLFELKIKKFRIVISIFCLFCIFGILFLLTRLVFLPISIVFGGL